MQLILDAITEKVGQANCKNLATALQDFECVANLGEVLPGDVEHSNKQMVKLARVFLNESVKYVSDKTPQMRAIMRLPIAIISGIVRSEERRWLGCD